MVAHGQLGFQDAERQSIPHTRDDAVDRGGQLAVAREPVAIVGQRLERAPSPGRSRYSRSLRWKP